MPRILLHEPFSRHGEWHEPEHPERKIPGSLAYSPERIQLDLNSALNPVDGDVSVSDPVTSYPVIHGTSTKGELLTLLRATRSSVSLSFGSAGIRQPETVTSSWLLVGAHVNPDERYRSLTFFVPGLTAWLGRSPLSYSLVHEKGAKNYSEHLFRTNIEPELTRLDKQCAIIRWGAGTTSSTNIFKKVEIEVIGWFEVVPDTPQPLEWFFEQYSKLSSMLTILAGESIPAESITVSFPDTEYSAELLVSMGKGTYCQIKHPSDFYFPRSFTALTISDLVSNWFDEIDSVLIPSQLAVSTLNSHGLWLHVEFLSLIQALEGFHRGRFPGEYMASIDYEPVKSALTSVLPSSLSTDHRASLKSRIRYGNQLSLSRRLAELAELVGTDVSLRLFGTSSKVPRAWIDTRNYHTHWDSELLPNTLQGQALYNATIRMEHFVRALFLRLMGIDSKEISKALDHTSRCAQQLAHVNITERHKADPSQPKGTLYSVRTGPAAANQAETEPARTESPPKSSD